MNIKKIILIVAAIAVICGIGTAVIIGGNNVKSLSKNEKIHVVSSNFASYDFLRAIIGNNDNVELTFLIGPGKDAHSYDPTAQDLIKIRNADLFVYVGGEMENWSEKVLDSIDKENMQIICISDFVDKIQEKDVDGAEEDEYHEDEKREEGTEHEEDEHHVEGSFDEHIWSSPENAIKMIKTLEDVMEKIDNVNLEKYNANAEKYINEIKKVDSEIQNIVDNKVRNRLVFADKMPMQYFIDYYKLDVSAAFNGCSTETEPSAKTIAYLQNKIKEEKIPVVLYIELNPGIVAKTIAKETGSEALQIQALHNISLDDFNKGETWVSLMTRNIDVLKKALQ